MILLDTPPLATASLLSSATVTCPRFMADSNHKNQVLQLEHFQRIYEYSEALHNERITYGYYTRH